MHLPLRAITVFHAAARAGSISKAASELGVTPSAVSQQIQALEIQLGTSLMTRIGRRIALTEAGERYFDSITDEIQRIAEATKNICGYRSITTLTVRATPTLANKWLLPRLGSFLDAYPDIEVRLDGTNESTDFSRDAVDLEIRHGSGRWPGLFSEGLTEESFVPVCAPSFLATSFLASASLAPAAVAACRLIHSVKSQAQWAQWFTLAGVAEPARWPRIHFDRSHMAIDAAAGGLGIALESRFMMWRELGNGTLVCPVRLPPRLVLTTQWIVCPNDHLRQRKTRVFLDWLRHQRDLAAQEATAID